MSKNYDSNALTTLTGLAPVRRRPGMYTDTETPNHLCQEIVDNSVDEAMAGHASEISVTIRKDGFIEIVDNGRGIPVDTNKETGKNGVEMVFTTLHSGGKFNNENYKFSGGLHGVGASVVNALSEELSVRIKRNGKVYFASFENGEPKDLLAQIKGEKVELSDTGTKIAFKPDPVYFDTVEVNESKLLHLLKGKSILCPGLLIRFVKEETGQVTEFCFSGGVSDFLDVQPNRELALGDVAITGLSTRENPPMEIEWGCYFTPEQGTLSLSYANAVPTPLGGTHVQSFRTGIFEGMQEYMRLHNCLPKGGLSNRDVVHNLNFVVALKMQEPKFAGQTKERLSSRECVGFITTQVRDAFSLYLSQNFEQVAPLVEQVLKNANKRIRDEKKVERKSLDPLMPLPGKLTDCSIENRIDAEIFFVEGDSAGGSAKQARDRETQAIMPLRGKILNTWEVSSSEVLASKEVADIASAIGVDPGSSNLEGLRYGKVCILADADSDGLHIATLFCALMLAHFPALVEQGHVYVAQPPLYRIDIGKKVFYALDDEERDEMIASLKARGERGAITVQRFKGLGEMNPEQLRETTLDPSGRRLMRLTVSDGEEAQAMYDMLLMKRKASMRNEWLQKNGDRMTVAE